MPTIKTTSICKSSLIAVITRNLSKLHDGLSLSKKKITSILTKSKTLNIPLISSTDEISWNQFLIELSLILILLFNSNWD